MKKPTRLAVFVAGILLLPAFGFAQDVKDFPDKPVTLIIPYGPGGGTDVLGRILGQKLSEIWKQPVIINNRPGASGLIGAKAAMASTPDGYTLVVGSTGTLTSVAKSVGVTSKSGFSVADSLSPITMVAAPPYMVAVTPKLGVKTIGELIAYAKANPGKVTYASSGVGSASHLTGALFNKMAGVNMRHIPYKGTGQAVVDLLGGEVSALFGPAPTLEGHVKSGSLIALAVTPLKRSKLFPTLPTVEESGVPGFESVGWFGLFAPKGMSTEMIDKISVDALKALASKDVEEQMANIGSEPAGMSVKEFTEYVNRDIVKWITLREEVLKK